MMNKAGPNYDDLGRPTTAQQPGDATLAETIANLPPRPVSVNGRAEPDKFLRGVDQARPTSGAMDHGGLRGAKP